MLSLGKFRSGVFRYGRRGVLGSVKFGCVMTSCGLAGEASCGPSWYVQLGYGSAGTLCSGRFWRVM